MILSQSTMLMIGILVTLLHQAAVLNANCVADIALVVDHSGSIRDNNVEGEPDNWATILSFLQEIVRGLNVGKDGTHVAAISYGNNAKLDFNLDDYYDIEQMLVAILDIEYRGGNTNSTGGMRLARQEVFTGKGGDRPDVTDILLLMTDGVPTREEDGLLPEATRIKNNNVRLMAVGVTNQVNETILKSLVTNAVVDYHPVTDFSGLNFVLDQVIQSTCQRATTTTPAPTTPTTWSLPIPECSQPCDLVFVIDASGSINEENFEMVRNFMQKTVSLLDVDTGNVRVGIVTFADQAYPQFDLNKYDNRMDIGDAVNEITFSRGTTNTAGALQYCRESMFTVDGGDRSDSPNLVIVVTDGGSNDKDVTIDEAYKLKKSGVHIISIGVGGWTDVEELNNIASYPHEGNRISVKGYDALMDQVESVLDIVCNNVNECESSPCINGGTCVDAVLAYICNCPSGFAGRNCERSCKTPVDLVVALDSSGSVGKSNYREEINFVREIVVGMNFDLDSRLALETFGNDADIIFNLGDHLSKLDLMNGLTTFYSGGTTNAAAAILKMREEMFLPDNGDRDGVQNVGLVFLDGRTDDSEETWQESIKNRDAGIHMMAVGIGNGAKQSELETIASYPAKSNVFNVSSFDSLMDIQDAILTAMCDNVNECESNPCPEDAECQDLVGAYECICPEGTQGVNCERACTSMVDIIYVIDSSGSIRSERFPFVLDWIIDMIEDQDIGPDKTRIGAVKYSDSASIQFHLDAYDTKQDVISAISKISFSGGRTHTSASLDLLTNMFSSEHGGREGARDMCIVLTDGNSNINADQTVPSAIEIRENGIHVVVVGIGDAVNRYEMEGIASKPPNSTVFKATSYRDLPDIVDDLVDAVCDDVNDCESNPCNNGGQCLDQLKMYECDCQTDFTGRNCERRCTRSMDVSLILDFTGSLADIYDSILDSAAEIVYGLPVGSDRARIATLYLVESAAISFYLDSYSSKSSILNALSYKTAGGTTNTQDVIRMMYEEVFVANRGDRSGVDNICVLITDGKSNRASSKTLQRAQEARDLGIEMYVIAVGDGVDMVEVNGIASDPDSEYVILMDKADDPAMIANKLLDLMCA